MAIGGGVPGSKAILSAPTAPAPSLWVTTARSGGGQRSIDRGTTPEARNIISANGGLGNFRSVLTAPAASHRSGKLHGTDVTGTVALGNFVFGSFNLWFFNLIGGLVPVHET